MAISSLVLQAEDLDDVIAAIAARSVEMDRTGRVPHESVRALLDSGFGRLRLPVQLGGLGLSQSAFLERVVDLGAADPGVAHLFLNHFLALDKIMRRRREEHEHLLALAASGALFSECAIEADPTVTAGGGATSTALTRTGDRTFELTGTKAYATGSTVADIFLVTAVMASEHDDNTQKKVTVAVSRSAAGVNIVDDWDGFGQRLSGSGTVRFDRVSIGENDIVFWEPDTEPYHAASPQLFMTAIVAGVVRAVRDDGAATLSERTRNFYHGSAAVPAEDPTLHVVLGQLVTDAFTAAALVATAAQALDLAEAGSSAEERRALRLQATVQCSMAKIAVDEVAQRAASTVFDLGGASATSTVRALDRHWRNIRTLANHNPDVYKRRVVGEWFLHDTPPPRRGFF